MCGDTMARWRWKTKGNLLIFPLGMKTELKPQAALSFVYSNGTSYFRCTQCQWRCIKVVLVSPTVARARVAVCAAFERRFFVWAMNVYRVMGTRATQNCTFDPDGWWRCALQMRLAIRNSIYIVLAISMSVCVCVRACGIAMEISIRWSRSWRSSSARFSDTPRHPLWCSCQWLLGLGLWKSGGGDLFQLEIGMTRAWEG